MSRIKILDCTLRDGGYINSFQFGADVIKDVIRRLTVAGIEIIECGFLQSGAFDLDKSVFGSVEQIAAFLPGTKTGMYVGMIQYGKISNDEISPCDGSSIEGIRVTFHEHEIDGAFILGKQLQQKGYRVFMQPVGSTTYSLNAFERLIERVNEMHPFSFYLVDTLGTMYKDDLIRTFKMVDERLDQNICVGFHSHNNLQLSFANAQELMNFDCKREIIVDTSVNGMGRGAGNLCTELFAQYINTRDVMRYDTVEILEIIDRYIKPLKLMYRWGYDEAYFLSSTLNCHPNYASYLLGLQTLHVQDIYAILCGLEPEKRTLFDKKYVQERYVSYMISISDETDELDRLKILFENKRVILIAPGRTVETEKDKIMRYLQSENVVSISVNFIPDRIPIDAMFISNLKRFSEQGLVRKDSIQIIATSNIGVKPSDSITVLKYASLLNSDERIVDNAGLMCINMLRKLGCTDIALAGFDGFNSNAHENYSEKKYATLLDADRIMDLNVAISSRLREIGKQIKLSFLTTTAYDVY